MENPLSPPLIPLDQVTVRCAGCRTRRTCADLNEDKDRFYGFTWSGLQAESPILFPSRGLTEAEVDRVKHLELYCEECKDQP